MIASAIDTFDDEEIVASGEPVEQSKDYIARLDGSDTRYCE